MSLDKLVDSTQLDADLTSIANAIRTKGGTSASLAFPAGFVSAVAAIPSGGGANSATGTITPATNTLTATFDIGANYDRFVLYPETSHNSSARGLRVAVCDFSKSNSTLLLFSTNNTGGGVVGVTYYGTGTLTKSGNNVTYASSNNNLYANVTYRWVAW